MLRGLGRIAMAGLHSLFDGLVLQHQAVWLSDDHADIDKLVRKEHCAH
jgi:hypothetical protein